MRRILSCILLFMILVGGTACGSIAARQAMHKGIRYYKAHRFEDASKQFEAVTQYDDSWSEAWLNRGFSCKQAFIPNSTSDKDKEFAQCAIESFKKYVELTPDGQDHDDGVEYLISVFLDSRRQEEALAYFLPVAEANPGELKKIQAVRAIYQSMGNAEKTEEWLLKELTLTPADKQHVIFYTLCATNENRARVSQILTREEKYKKIETGIEQCKKAVELKEDYAEAYAIYNLIYRDRANLKAAEAGEESDTAKQEALNAEARENMVKADELRLKAQALFKARKDAEMEAKGLTPVPAPPASAPAALPAPATPLPPASAASAPSAPVPPPASAAGH